MPLTQIILDPDTPDRSANVALEPRVNIFIGDYAAGIQRIFQNLRDQARTAVGAAGPDAPWLRQHYDYMLSPGEQLEIAALNLEPLSPEQQSHCLQQAESLVQEVMPHAALSRFEFQPAAEEDEPSRLLCQEHGQPRDTAQLGSAAQRLIALTLSLSIAAAAHPGQPGILIAQTLDSSLHPSSQNRLLPALTAMFPQVQIFATVRGDLTLMGLQPGQLHHVARADGLDQIQVTTTTKPIGGGWSPDDVLRQFHGMAHPTDLQTAAAAAEYLEREKAAGDQPDPEVYAQLEKERRGFNPEVLYTTGEHQVREMKRILTLARAEQQQQQETNQTHLTVEPKGINQLQPEQARSPDNPAQPE